MATLLLPVQVFPLFEVLDEKLLKPAERNFIKFKRNGQTMFVILTGGQNDTFKREEGQIGELVLNRAPPTRHNIMAFENLLSDRLIKRGEDAKKINVTLEVLQDGTQWDDYYTIWDSSRLDMEAKSIKTESERLAFSMTHLFLGNDRYLGTPNPEVYNDTNLKGLEVFHITEELDTVKVDGKFVDYKKRVFKPTKIEDLTDSEKTLLTGVKVGKPLVARLFEAPADYLEVPRDAYIKEIIGIEKRPKPANDRDNLAGGANHINKVFSNCLSKVQQRANPKRGGNSENIFTNALGAQIISNKKASNGTNAASSETPVQTWQAVLRLLGLFQRTAQSDPRKTLAISCIARIITSMSTYENNIAVKTAFTQKGNLIKGRIDSEPNSIHAGNELLEFVKHFGAWAVKNGTASTDQIIPTPGSLSMFGIWIEQEPETIPLAVKVARFQNVCLAALEKIPTTMYSWKPDTAEAFTRALTTFNLYDAPPETVNYCLSEVVEERPRQYPFASSGSIGIIPNGVESPLLIDETLLKCNVWITKALVQKARVQETVELQPITAYINPRGFNGEYIDTVKFLDEKKSEVISYEETVQNILESKPNDYTKTVRSTWFDVGTGEPIQNGGPKKITNYLGVGPFANLDYSTEGKDINQRVEIFMQFLTSGLAHSSKVLKRTSKAAGYTEDEFLKLPEVYWPLLQKRKLRPSQEPPKQPALKRVKLDVPGDSFKKSEETFKKPADVPSVPGNSSTEPVVDTDNEMESDDDTPKTTTT